MGMHPDVPLHVVQRDREAIRLLFDTLWTGAEALHLLGDAPLAFPEFRLLAIDLLRDVTLDQPLPSAGSLRVLGVRDILGLDVDYVFVPGLADTEFHVSDLAPGQRYTLLLLDGNRAALCQPWELATFPVPDERPEKFRLLIYSCAGGHDALPDHKPTDVSTHRFLTLAVRRRCRLRRA